jgi:hypothetical protein
MRDDELLELWTRAAGSAAATRGRVLAGVLARVPEPADAPIGELNRALLAVWREEFGDRMECVASCTACGERLEFELSAGAILGAGSAAAEPPAIEHGGHRLAVRTPTPRDLDAVAGAGSAELAKRELARRLAGLVDVSDELVDAVSGALAAADPHISVGVALACPACSADFRATVDVGAHVWAAVDSRARRVIAEVAELAAAYGWTEDEVLRLPSARRRAYAERVGR